MFSPTTLLSSVFILRYVWLPGFWLLPVKLRILPCRIKPRFSLHCASRSLPSLFLYHTYHFHIHGTFTCSICSICRSPMLWALMHPQTITEAGFLHFPLVTVWMVFFIFGMWNPTSVLPGLDSPDQRTRFHCLSVHLRGLSAQRTRGAFLRQMIKCLPLCIIQFQVAFLDAQADCVEWQWFSKVLLSPRGCVHHGSMTVSQTIPPEGSMVTCIQQRFPPLAFHLYFPWLPGSFHDIMDLNSLQSLCWETWSLNWLTILSQKPQPILASRTVLLVTFPVFCLYPNFFWVWRHLLFFIFTKYNWGLSVKTLFSWIQVQVI